ncbi:hypothetical protein F2Q69_00015902 [Brassica cretica]|uniref:Uncharacterized protein n=1 Tax=Brassica cretica TaxID=69181 RepID=A0A8S9QR15_BRACR|nr:hypothetical protein F2Q69_00015902 [Brassica cretica]
MTYLPEAGGVSALRRCTDPLVSWFCLFCSGSLSHFLCIVLLMSILISPLPLPLLLLTSPSLLLLLSLSPSLVGTEIRTVDFCLNKETRKTLISQRSWISANTTRQANQNTIMTTIKYKNRKKRAKRSLIPNLRMSVYNKGKKSWGRDEMFCFLIDRYDLCYMETEAVPQTGIPGVRHSIFESLRLGRSSQSIASGLLPFGIP